MNIKIRDDSPTGESWRFVCFECRQTEKILVHMGDKSPDDDKMFCGACLAKALNILEVAEVKAFKPK